MPLSELEFSLDYVSYMRGGKRHAKKGKELHREDKVGILRKHLFEKMYVFDQYGFYPWKTGS